MSVGDSLLEKISSAISEMDFFGVVISAHSAKSSWVARELEIAMNEEIQGQRVKVIPLLLRGGELPPGLPEKIYADFTLEPLYDGSVKLLLARLKNARDTPDQAADRFAELAASSGLLTVALDELRGDGLSNATADALVSSNVTDIELSEFFALAAEELSDFQLFGLAISLPEFIDKRGVGHKALEACLRTGRLSASRVAWVARRMQHVESPAAILYCHGLMTSTVRNDERYFFFLKEHVGFLMDQCPDDVMAYLLHPYRGPRRNLNSFMLAIGHTRHPAPFLNRVYDWINDGYFDRDAKDGGVWPDRLYIHLNMHWEEEPFKRVAEKIENRVHLLMKSEDLDYIRGGFFHLVAMAEVKYCGAERVLRQTLLQMNVVDGGGEDGKILMLIRDALKAVAAYRRDPSDSRLEANADSAFHKIEDADTQEITGYWAAE